MPTSSLPFNIIIVAIISVTVISWIIAFAGSIASSQTIEFFPKFTWWGLVFQLIIVILIPVLYFTNSAYYYRSFLLCILTIAFIYTSNSANNLVYFTDSSSSAAGTGFILLSMTNFLWLFYLGSDPNAPIIKFINTYGDPIQLTPFESKRISLSNNQRSSSYNYRNTQSTTNLHGNNNDDDIYSGLEDSHELAGFENPVNSSSIQLQHHQQEDSDFNDSAFRQSGINNNGINGNSNVMNNNTHNNIEGTNFTGISSVTGYMESYPILVRALYTYTANPDDVNEMSFNKGEVFRVKNTNGNWWQAKNKRGEIGMCPSNYLEIVT